ncbi:hypothetical protein DFH27DRAFT_550190 [Peziza echinospora]|nr:hypothetical protein DFH27DRAFT_550190 [Peziza echinospora]
MKRKRKKKMLHQQQKQKCEQKKPQIQTHTPVTPRAKTLQRITEKGIRNVMHLKLLRKINATWVLPRGSPISRSRDSYRRFYASMQVSMQICNIQKKGKRKRKKRRDIQEKNSFTSSSKRSNAHPNEPGSTSINLSTPHTSSFSFLFFVLINPPRQPSPLTHHLPLLRHYSEHPAHPAALSHGMKALLGEGGSIVCHFLSAPPMTMTVSPGRNARLTPTTSPVVSRMMAVIVIVTVSLHLRIPLGRMGFASTLDSYSSPGSQTGCHRPLPPPRQ